MPKNPFLNCKSRKRRKPRVVINKPDVKLFCPRTMVRYDDAPNEYKTMFVCKMCLTCVLSENAVKSHIIRCNEASKKVIPVKKDEESRYICEFCNRVFSRKVALKKHKEQHETASDVESDEEFVSPPSRKLLKASNDRHISVQYNVDEGPAVEHVEGEDGTTNEDAVVATDNVDSIAIKRNSVAAFKDVVPGFEDEITIESAVTVAETENETIATVIEVEDALTIAETAAVAEAAAAAVIAEAAAAAAAALDEDAAAAATLEGLI